MELTGLVVAFADIQEQMNMVNTVKRSICETIPEIQHNKANTFKTNGNKSFKTRNAEVFLPNECEVGRFPRLFSLGPKLACMDFKCGGCTLPPFLRIYFAGFQNKIR